VSAYKRFYNVLVSVYRRLRTSTPKITYNSAFDVFFTFTLNINLFLIYDE